MSNESVIIEIHAAEGGDDAKLLVRDQARIYAKACQKTGIVVEIVNNRSGIIVLQATGKGAKKLFANEKGGHRWQRCPPTEKRGRVHTSTITVAVLNVPTASEMILKDKDLEITTCRATGAGGQKINKTDSAVQVKHTPTGTIVRCESERSQIQNKQTALDILRAKLSDAMISQKDAERNSDRRSQVGSGMRGDKRRTIQLQNDTVVDHVLGKKCRPSDYLRGDMSWLE